MWGRSNVQEMFIGTWDVLPLNEMTGDDVYRDEIPGVVMSVVEMSLDEVSLSSNICRPKICRQNVCRQNVCRPKSMSVDQSPCL